MSGAFIKKWVVVFLAVFAWSYVWHSVLLLGFYKENLALIARYVGDMPTPLMAYLALGNIIAAFGLSKFVPSCSRSRGEFVINGALMGLVIFGSFAVLSYAIFEGWTAPLMFADAAFGVTAGALAGWVMSRFS